MSGGGDKGNKSATSKAPESQKADPGKCDKKSAEAEPGGKEAASVAKPGAVGKVSQAKDKFSLPFGKSKCAEKGKSKDSSEKKKYTLKDRIKDIKDGFAEISKNRKEKKEQKCKAVAGAMSSGPGGPGGGRRMIYPYTLSAKIAQFPFRYHYDNVWLFKYFVIGSVVCLPLFIYLGRISHTPENVAEWKKNREELFGLRHH